MRTLKDARFASPPAVEQKFDRPIVDLRARLERLTVLRPELEPADLGRCDHFIVEKTRGRGQGLPSERHAPNPRNLVFPSGKLPGLPGAAVEPSLTFSPRGFAPVATPDAIESLCQINGPLRRGKKTPRAAYPVVSSSYAVPRLPASRLPGPGGTCRSGKPGKFSNLIISSRDLPDLIAFST